MNINLIYPSKYVKAADLGDKQVTVTIKSAVMEELGYGAEKERKLVIYFEKATKGLILNRTNAMIIASMYSPETDNWIGNAIILYSMRVKAFGSWHDAVRVKEQVPPRNVGAAKMPEAMQEAPPIDDEDDVLDVDEGQELDSLTVDADTGEIIRKSESPPHKRLFGQLTSGFGPDADAARPWLIEKWTHKVSPGLERTSAAELSDDEKDLLADYLRDNLTAVQRAWKNHKATLVQATSNGKVAA